MTKKLDMKEVEVALKRKVAQTYNPVKAVEQFGFVHNNTDCIGCRACEIACKDKNGLPPGPRFRRVMYVEGGTFPDVYAYKVNMSCNHCAEPACLPTCPTGAIWKREKDGIVDIDSTLCIGCRKCEAACPYGAPAVECEGTDCSEMQWLCGRNRCRTQAVLCASLHDAGAGFWWPR